MVRQTEELLRQVARRIIEPVPQGLADRIKKNIPHPLVHSRWGRGAINIIVHFRISRLAAVAAIVITLVACTAFFGKRDHSSGGLYDDLKTLVQFLPGRGAPNDQVMAGLYNYSVDLRGQGKDVVYYGNIVDKPNHDTLLMYWRLDDGTYRVIFGDFHVDQLDARKLLEAQSRMIKTLKH